MVRFEQSFDFEKKLHDGKKKRIPIELYFTTIFANQSHMFTLDQQNCLKYKSVTFKVTEEVSECKGVTFESLRQSRLSYDEGFKYLFYIDQDGFL